MKKGDICLIEFMSFRGHEQMGFRPAIAMSEETANLILVIPLTSKLEALKYNYSLEISPSKTNGLNTKSIAMIFQLRAVDKRKIKGKIGNIEEDVLDNINNQIKKMLKLK